MAGSDRFELRAEELEPQFDRQKMNFDTTDSLEPLEEIIGQPRAVRALEMGLGIHDSSYNIYVAGLSGMGKMSMIKDFLSKRIDRQSTPSDWIYVHNFNQEDRPLAIEMKAGRGNELKKDMNEAVEHLRDELPKAFREEDFSKEKMRINQHYEQRGREIFDSVDRLAEEKGLIVQQAPDGRILMIPKVDGRPMTTEEFDKLSDNEKDDITKKQQELGQLLGTVLTQQRDLGRRLREDVHQVERNFAARRIEPLIDEIIAKHDNEKLKQWLAELKQHMIANLHRFQERESSPAPALPWMMQQEETFTEYQINVVIDNSETGGVPVIIEESPNYKNMFGTIHGTIDRTGKFYTSFIDIKAGSLLRANGGYLVYNMLEALMEPLVWKELKRTIKSGYHEYHMYDPFGVFVTSALRPEPIPLKVKMVVVGNPLVYHLMQLYDEDFSEIFKVKADFAPEIDRADGTDMQISRFVRKLKEDPEVLPFDNRAIMEVIRTSTRFSGDKKKITAEFSRIADLVREASFWAREDKAAVVTEMHVRKAVDEKIYRSNLFEERIRDLIEEGTLLISIDGTAVGQVNGLAVIDLGDYMFGRPTRLTASVGIGAAGIINIERESRLSGRSFDKAMLIIEGYMRNKYAKKHPIALSASIAMEQSYGMIEGDSATIAELACLLSAFAGIPLRQDIAITGSVNQWGQIQPVGGVSEKIEGYYRICKKIGLTGNQGVCIPSANIRNLILHPEVVDTVRESRFHIWAVKNVDEAIELLTGIPAGEVDETGTFHWRVDTRLREMLDIAKEQKPFVSEREFPSYHISPDGNRDPRPKLPGEESEIK